jgi:CubicO group peptidase (beta-lactamase class C family)
MVHLLTHTASFEDPAFVTTTGPEEVQPLGSYRAEHMPPQLRPPGEACRYCNCGYALAGYVVEEVWGLPFHQ